MFMAIEKDKWWNEPLRRPQPCPKDFEQTFVRIGRAACEEHYGRGRRQIDAWLDELGKDRLINERYEFVANQGRGSPRGPAKRITRNDMAQILKQAFPVRDHRRVNPNTAR